MTIIFYINRSEANKINKHLAWVEGAEAPPRIIGEFKEDTSTTSPQIMIEALTGWPFDGYQLVYAYNYCYIVELKRYYFIADRTIGPNKFILLSLELDPLMSFKDTILRSKARVVSYQNSTEEEINNGALNTKSSSFTRIIKWENAGLNVAGSLVLLTAGPQKFTNGGA